MDPMTDIKVNLLETFGIERLREHPRKKIKWAMALSALK